MNQSSTLNEETNASRTQSPLVTVIIPTRNEEGHIRGVLNSLLDQDFSLGEVEILVVDGRSTDSTREIVADFGDRVVLLDNPERTVPQALNQGIEHAKGDYVVRMDAHADYPRDYLSRLIETMLATDAENVGGVWQTFPANDSLVARVVAAVSSSRFGVGNSAYRFGGSQEREVDTVPYGCYRREIFDRIGRFDEDLIRNQDDEFNARLKRHGGKILLLPDVVIGYFARENVIKAMKMFYQYGLFKPLVLKKIGAPATLRQLVPPCFVLVSCLLLAVSPLSSVAWLGLVVLYSLYATMAVAFSIPAALRERDIRMLVLQPFVFLSVHFSYGLGYLDGIIRFWLLGKVSTRVEITR